MTDIDFDALADINAAIEDAGGDVLDFESRTETPQPDGIAAALSSMMAGQRERTVYQIDVTIPGPTTRDIPDTDARVDAGDAMKAVAIAHDWANRQNLEAMVADLEDVGERISDQVTGQAHPSDEIMPEFGGDGE